MQGLLTPDLISLFDRAPLGVCVMDGEKRLYANALFQKLLPGGPPAPAQSGEIPLGKEGWGRLTVTAEKGLTLLWLEDLSAERKTAAEAKASADMKSAFLASMSHELRTPMQSVYGLLELIHDEPIPAETREMVVTARKSASAMLEILDDILDLAKVEAGKLELDHFEVPLRTLAYGVMETMEVKLMGRPIRMLTEVEESVPHIIMGDPTRLWQIMLNLVGNAMKFTQKGSIVLRIHTRAKTVRAPEGGLVLRFEVEDTGIGMKPETCQKLFKAFTQADNSTTRKFGGTGLGLSISQKLTELMGGQIGVDSVEGQGSTFWFEIPTAVASDQTAVELPNLDGLAVLSVEDHPRGAKEILSSLTSMGAKVESVPTYAEGLELIKKRPFDVLIADQGLPDGLGIDLLKEAAKLRPFMGLILYTVRDDIGLHYSTEVIGAKYLPKPASRLGLGEAVKGAAKQVAAIDPGLPRRLLIAEDTPAVQDVLRRQLAKLNIEADFVENGVLALKALEKHEHGILFTDLHMPEMDGYQLVAAIRAAEEKSGGKRFPVVAITADVQLTQRQAYLGYGFDECMLKPVSLGQLKQLLIRWGVLQERPGEAAPAAAETALPSAVDRKALIQQMGEIDAGVIEMLGMFVGMTRPLLDKIDAAYAAKDMHALGEAAHSLKGSARSACLPKLGDLAAEMQESAEKDRPIAAGAPALIRAEFERAAAEISAFRV